MSLNNTELKKRRIGVTISSGRGAPPAPLKGAGILDARSRSVWVSDLAEGTQEAVIQQAFERHGKVERVLTRAEQHAIVQFATQQVRLPHWKAGLSPMGLVTPNTGCRPRSPPRRARHDQGPPGPGLCDARTGCRSGLGRSVAVDVDPGAVVFRPSDRRCGTWARSTWPWHERSRRGHRVSAPLDRSRRSHTERHGRSQPRRFPVDAEEVIERHCI